MPDLEVTVKLADTEVFQKMLELFKEIVDDEGIPAEKRKRIVDQLLEIGAIKE